MKQSRATSVVIRVAVAMVFAAGAWLSWRESTLSARVAETREAVATLRYAEANTTAAGRTLSDYLPGQRQHLGDDVRSARASVAYWLGRYSEVAADTSSSGNDGVVLLAAANASYRERQRDPGEGLAAVQKLDGVLQACASAMKASVGSVALAKEAAYKIGRAHV